MAKNVTLPEILDYEEVNRLKSIPNKRYPTGLRNRAIIDLMLNTGLRVSEVINLKPSDVKLTDKPKVTVKQGKGKKDRMVTLRADIIDILKAWESIKPKDTKYYFTTLEGTRLNRIYIYNMIKRYSIKARIDKSIHPHTLRHTFATDYYRQTKDIETLRMILGHDDIATTNIYITLSNVDIENGMNSTKAL